MPVECKLLIYVAHRVQTHTRKAGEKRVKEYNRRSGTIVNKIWKWLQLAMSVQYALNPKNKQD